MTLIWASGTHQGLVRSNNEDRPFPTSSGSGDRIIVAVADGMGGHVGGEVASRLAIEAATSGTGIPVADRVQAANESVFARSIEDGDLAGMGTTLTVADISEGSAHIGHVGDSRCYLIRDGEIRLLTKDHTVATQYALAGKITEEEAERHPQRHILTRALGLEASVEVDVYEEPVAAGDRLLLCSDGLNGMIHDSEILDVGSRGTPDEAVWALIEQANLAGGFDNITVVIVDVQE